MNIRKKKIINRLIAAVSVVVAVCFIGLITYLKDGWNYELEIRSRVYPSFSIEEAMYKGVFLKAARVIDRNKRISPFVTDMWVERKSEVKYIAVFIKQRHIVPGYRLVLKSHGDLNMQSDIDLCDEQENYFGRQSRGDDDVRSYYMPGDTIPERLKVYVRSFPDKATLDTVEFVL